MYAVEGSLQNSFLFCQKNLCLKELFCFQDYILVQCIYFQNQAHIICTCEQHMYVFSHFNSCNRSTFPAFHFSACKQQYHSKVGVDIFTNLLYFCPPQTRDHCFLECRKGLFSSRPFKVIQLSLGLYTAMKITTSYSNVVILQSNSFQNYYFRVYEEQ